MVTVKKIVLDVLKPHQPNVLDFAKAIAEAGEFLVRVKVIGVDEHTESLEVEVDGDSVVLDELREVIASLGGSVHSIDQVIVQNRADSSAG